MAHQWLWAGTFKLITKGVYIPSLVYLVKGQRLLQNGPAVTRGFAFLESSHQAPISIDIAVTQANLQCGQESGIRASYKYWKIISFSVSSVNTWAAD